MGKLMTTGTLATVNMIHVYAKIRSILYTFLRLSVYIINITSFHRFSDSVSHRV